MTSSLPSGVAGPVSVYDMAGRCVLRTTETRLTLPQAGVYVVQVVGARAKVVVH